MRTSIVALAIALTAAASPAWADALILTVQDQVPAQEPASAPVQEQAPPAPRKNSATASPPSRYSFQRVDDGFLRLDNASGHIAFCSPHTVGWDCQAVPEDRAALEKEIARQTTEIQRLQQDAQNEVQELENDLRDTFSKKLNPIITQLVAEKQLQILLVAVPEVIYWADTALDLTDEIVKRLDATSPGTVAKPPVAVPAAR